MNKKLVLIDGNSILNRTFYGIPDLTNTKGQHTNAVYGFLNILFKILEEEKADNLVVAFDVKHPTFRHEMYKEYKGTRKPMPEELREQLPLMKEVLKAMGISIIEKAGFEADDILGTLARQGEKEGYKVSLVSGDRDLLQLATEQIKIRIPKTKRTGTEIEDYFAKDVIEKYGVTPLQFIDLKGLMGDASDNIPGVPGIGEKTASKIITQFHSIENAILNVEDIMPKKAKENLIEFEEQARMSKILATIKTDCSLDLKIEDARIDNIFNEDAYVLMKQLEFKSLLSKFEGTLLMDNKKEINVTIVKQKSQVESIWEQLRIVMEKEEVIGLHLLTDNQEQNKKANGMKTETNGQMALFADNKENITGVLGLAVSFQQDGEIATFFIVESEQVPGQIIIEKVKELIAHNAVLSVFDLKQLLYQLNCTDEEDMLKGKKEGKKIFDCGIAAYLLNPIKDTYNYDDIGRDYLDLTIPSYSDLFGKKKVLEARNENEDAFFNYGGYLSYVAFSSKKILTEKLKEENMLELFEQIEMPLVYTLYDMEYRGIKINKEELKEYGTRLGESILILEKEIYDLVDETFNINSPKQLGVILFEKMKLPFAKKTKTGYSTSADILEKLKDDYPVVAKILEYRQLTKLKSTYADGLANYINLEDGRIHGTFNQTITATGRLSSTEPNLQNIPIRMKLGRQIRKVFIPKDGFVFLDADYSQIELRILAHMSGDERLIKAYKSEQDIHRITASEVFHTPLEEVTPLQRSNAKAVNFGIVYGISSFGLGQDLNISRKEAEVYINKYFETYPRVKEFLNELVKTGKEKGYVVSMFQRKRPIPELSSGNFMQRSFGERIAMNSPIQGTAADIMKISMIRVNETLKERAFKSKVLLQIHDELLVETHMDEVDSVAKILQEEMSKAAELAVQLEVEVKKGLNWEEAH